MWATMSRTPASRQAATIASHSATSSAIGFSRKTCFPAAAAACESGTWVVCGVAITTASMSLRASSASTEGSTGTP